MRRHAKAVRVGRYPQLQGLQVVYYEFEAHEARACAAQLAPADHATPSPPVLDAHGFHSVLPYGLRSLGIQR